MRICISSLPLDTFGGAERVVISDAQHFVRAGHDVHIIADGFDSDLLSSYGLSEHVDTHRITVPQRGLLPDTFLRAYELRRRLRAIEPDAVIAHELERPTWLALATLNIDPHFVTHVHGSLFWFKNDTRRTAHMWKECARELVTEVPGHSEFWAIDGTTLAEKVRAFGTESIELMALRSCDEVFVNTRQVARELNCLYGVEATVNPPGIDDDRTPNATDGGLPLDSPFIFSLSRLDPRKRIDLLISAFAEFRNLRPEFRLVIGGTGEQEASLKELAAETGVQDAITFAGHVDEALLAAYYAEAEVFACPGWISYGLTPLEAIHSGTKVALSSDAFVKEMIEDQEGVEVLAPDIEAWVSGLDQLVGCDNQPSSTALPTVREHAAAKLAAFDG